MKYFFFRITIEKIDRPKVLRSFSRLTVKFSISFIRLGFSLAEKFSSFCAVQTPLLSLAQESFHIPHPQLSMHCRTWMLVCRVLTPSMWFTLWACDDELSAIYLSHAFNGKQISVRFDGTNSILFVIGHVCLPLDWPIHSPYWPMVGCVHLYVPSAFSHGTLHTYLLGNILLRVSPVILQPIKSLCSFRVDTIKNHSYEYRPRHTHTHEHISLFLADGNFIASLSKAQTTFGI